MATFSQARPPGVYKQDFIDVLSHRYGDDQWLIGPAWPAWCERCAKGNEQYKVSEIDEIASGVIESSSQEEIPSCITIRIVQNFLYTFLYVFLYYTCPKVHLDW